MTRINGYPHSYYLVGVVVVGVVGALGELIATLANFGAWAAATTWAVSFVAGFWAARRVNAVLFRQRHQPTSDG